MAPVNLKKLLGKDGPRRLNTLLAPANEPLSVLDLDGNLVWGRVVEDIPDFCRELVAALGEGA